MTGNHLEYVIEKEIDEWMFAIGCDVVVGQGIALYCFNNQLLEYFNIVIFGHHQYIVCGLAHISNIWSGYFHHMVWIIF